MPFKVRVEEVDPRRIELLGKNARFMRHETFSRLKLNVETDGVLTSVPFCIPSTTEGYDWLVISGNHRVKAALAASLPTIFIMVTEDPLTPDQVKGIQLAHNSLVGEDDPVVLKEIYESIEDLAMKEYAGLDDKVLELLEKIGIEPMAAAQLEWTSVSFLFLPNEVDRVKAALDKAGKAARTPRFSARFSDYDRFMEAVSLAGDSYGVANTATALLLILDVFDRHIADLTEGFLDDAGQPKRKANIPVAAALGAHHVPAATAALLQKVVAEGEGDRWARLDEALSAYLTAG